MDDKWKARFERERQARKESEKLLVERAKALEVAHAQLAHLQAVTMRHEKTSETSELFATVSHELNTPLGVAIAASTFAVSELEAHPDPDSVSGISQALSLVVRNLDRASELISRFKQLAIDRVSTSVRKVDASEYLQDVLEGLRPALRVSGIGLQMDIDALGSFNAAVGPLSQVVTNLVMNAMHHAFVGETRDDPTISVSAHLIDQSLVLDVEDNGRGMSDEVVSRVFEPYFTTAVNQGGSGLGMHIVREIVSQVFRGSIDVDTATGRGTRWTVTLPFNDITTGLVRAD